MPGSSLTNIVNNVMNDDDDDDDDDDDYDDDDDENVWKGSKLMGLKRLKGIMINGVKEIGMKELN